MSRDALPGGRGAAAGSGVLLYEMAVGKMPFRGNDENELLWNVCYEQIHYPMFLTKELTSLLQSVSPLLPPPPNV